MKRKLLFMIVAFIAAFISCEENEPLPVAVTDVTLNVSSLELTEGEEYILMATVNPENAANKTVIWVSSDESVATVKDGKVTAVKTGTTTITVTTDDGGKTAACEVTVKTNFFHVESVSLDKTSLELTEGDETVLTAMVTPENATNKNVTWTSSDESVATVKDGKVTAVKAGAAMITITTEDGGKTASCEVTVIAKVIIPITGLWLNKVAVELKVGETVTLIADVMPENATNKNVAWSSSNEDVASVDKGEVKAIKAGMAIITASIDEWVAVCEVHVSEPGGNEGIGYDDYNY